MNKAIFTSLKILRKLYLKVSSSTDFKIPECEQDPDSASRKIYELLMENNPCMIARFGSTELTCLTNYLSIKSSNHKYMDFINGTTTQWWWEKNIIEQMQNWSGFFPPTIEKIVQFCELMLSDIPEVNLLGSWLASEHLFDSELNLVPKVRLGLLDPYWSKKPWTRALEGKKVLVIHPFAETITKQYEKRELLFEDNLLPSFELKTIKAIQSIAGEKVEFSDWFEALESMKNKIDNSDFDICLIAAGAYGFPLAAHVKRVGKKGFHYGGSLQLLFGIRGQRWEKKKYHDSYDYASLVNKHWVRPNVNESPQNAKQVEGGCYW